MLLQTNPFIYFQPGAAEHSLDVVDPIKNRRFQIADDVALKVLDLARRPLARPELVQRIAVSASTSMSADVDSLLDWLLAKGLLVEPDDCLTRLVAARRRWADRGWPDAFLYHLETRDYEFLQYHSPEGRETDLGLMREYVAAEAPPCPYKVITGPHGGEPLPLDRPAGSGCVPPEKGLTHATLSRLMFYTFGQTGTLEFEVTGTALLKTSPSGGARHPAEAYVLLPETPGLGAGVYHYAVRDHALISICRDPVVTFHDLFFQLTHYRDFTPLAVVVVTLLFERSMWRYREPRSFRAVFNDVGHLVKTAKVVAEWLGLRLVDGHGFDEARLAEMLRLETGRETPVYCLALGR